jgi:caspase domain-containing protein
MTKRALIVGVSEYRNYATPLVAAEFEAGEWTRLFRSYGFTQITVLTSRTPVPATRTNVLAALTALLSHSQKEDQLVFAFIGHGQVVRAHVEGKYEFEEALIAYPEFGDTQLKKAQITDSDVTKIVKGADLSDGSRLLIGLDTCWGAYFDVPIPPGAEVLSIPNPEFHLRDITGVREFGSLGGSEESERSVRPMIMAGAGRQETALQLPVNGRNRMLFSSRALDWLSAHHPTFHNLIYKDIVPLKKDYPQTPELRGDTSHENEIFPGESPAPLAAILPARQSAIALQRTEGDAMYWLDVRFQGLCCFADAPKESDPFKKRMLIPYDDRIDPTKKHIAFIEIAEDMALRWTGPGPTKTDPHGDGVRFLRWELKGHRIDFNAATASSLETTLSYQKCLPGLWTLCGSDGSLDYNPKAECFTPAPSPSLVAAFTDLSTGILTAGPLENVPTTYIRKTSGETHVIRTPKFVQWMLPIDQSAGVINLVPVNGGETTTITLKEGASVLIGNMRDADILEDPDAGAEVPESFLIYYYLAESPVYDPALPASTGVPINGCSSTGWP